MYRRLFIYFYSEPVTFYDIAILTVIYLKMLESCIVRYLVVSKTILIKLFLRNRFTCNSIISILKTSVFSSFFLNCIVQIRVVIKKIPIQLFLRNCFIHGTLYVIDLFKNSIIYLTVKQTDFFLNSF